MDNTLKCKGKFQFRLGCTSYVVPDNIVPNVEIVAPYVDDVELLCFEAPDRSYYIDEKTIDRLGELAQTYALSYTVHCPIDTKAGAVDEAERARFTEAFLKVFHLTAPLQPAGYVLHLEGLSRPASADETGAWQRRVTEVCHRITDGLTKEQRASVCLENLDSPLELIEAIADQFGFSLCIDVGHLWRYRDDWDGYCNRALSRTKIIHLHGVKNGTDHLSLEQHEVTQLSSFYDNMLRPYSGVVTLEVFSKQDVTESMKVMERLWAL